MSNPEESVPHIYERPEVVTEHTVEELGGIAITSASEQPQTDLAIGMALEAEALRASWVRTLTSGLRKADQERSR